MGVLREMIAVGVAASLAIVPGIAWSQDAAGRNPPAGLSRLLSPQSQMDPAELEQAVRDAADHPLGSLQNPVRTEGPSGQRAYLNRLRCADGKAPTFERQGSGGRSPFGGIVDYYAVQCKGAAVASVIMDMYHRGHQEAQPVPGFTITPIR